MLLDHRTKKNTQNIRGFGRRLRLVNYFVTTHVSRANKMAAASSSELVFEREESVLDLPLGEVREVEPYRCHGLSV